MKASSAPGSALVLDSAGNVLKFITWLRVGDEYMKILSVQSSATGPEEALVAVSRGLWGSPVTAHPANATALAPVYHASGCYPGGDKNNLRYALDPSREFTAQYVAASYEPGNYDGLWMDCFGSQPFRASNAFGDNMGRYLVNATSGTRYDRAGYVAAQRLLVTHVRTLTAARGATHL